MSIGGDFGREVVVTGVGVMTPGGTSVAAMWAFLLDGASSAVELAKTVVCDNATVFGCVIQEYPEGGVPGHLRRSLDRGTRLGLEAARAAIHDAGLDVPGSLDGARTGVVMGVGIGGLRALDEQGRNIIETGTTTFTARGVSKLMPNAVAASISIRHQTFGPCLTVSTACASGTDAIGVGAGLIRLGMADVVIAGGAEAMVSRTALSAFGRMTALSRRNDNPAGASRPFDKDRDGFVLADGAAVLVLEGAKHAQERRAKVWGTILGYAATADSHHLVRPSVDGKGARRCMSAAIRDSGLGLEDIGHVNAHGTSTQLNDRTEALAIDQVFQGSAPPITSCKGALGHSVGAAGAIEAVVALLSSCQGLIPPTSNCEVVDSAIHVDVVHGVPRETKKGSAVLSNSFGFGGHNGCVVLAGNGDRSLGGEDGRLTGE